MPLENLLELVETLKQRTRNHAEALRGSEALTRYALIDPLLRELGWDTSDPAVVVPEYRVPNNQIADYVLFHDDQPVIVVESKKLDEPLQSGRALDQGILYCAHTGSRYFLLTDGRRWQIYESGSTVPDIDLDLKDQKPAEFCLKALALWRPSVQAGYVAAGHSPVIVESDEDTPPVTPQPTVPFPIQRPEVEFQPWSGVPPGPNLHPHEVESQPEDWRPLTSIDAASFNKDSEKPSQILFPNERRTDIIPFQFDISMKALVKV